ncbi:MAG: response regulator transcription factor [Rhodospirillales bacterium]
MPTEPNVQTERGRIVLVDDDGMFREPLEQNLLDGGFKVVGFDDGASALGYLTDNDQADLVLLDWKMPEMNGIEVLRQLRKNDVSIPVIFLTVLSDQIYEETALLGGAVDFVEKSRSFAILLKRIELSLAKKNDRLAKPGADRQNGILNLGNMELHLESSRAYWKKSQLDLSLTEFKIIHYLATHEGNDVRYREIYDLVHGKDFAAGVGDKGYRSNVRTFIKRIRQKFRDIDPEFDQIENYPGFGYRWKNEPAGNS